jgi:hypothetical protein
MTEESDGIALHSTPHPFDITPQMVAAGRAAAEAEWRPDSNSQNMVRAVYTAMRHAEPPDPELDLCEESLVNALAEITLANDAVEELAIRAALGNNGGEWAEHYTEAQKQYWRDWVRDFFEHVLEAERRVRVITEESDAQESRND